MCALSLQKGEPHGFFEVPQIEQSQRGREEEAAELASETEERASKGARSAGRSEGEKSEKGEENRKEVKREAQRPTVDLGRKLCSDPISGKG